MKKPKYITVTLTRAEAECLWTAASQTLNHNDAMQATFSHVSHRSAAYRAADKIQSALHPCAAYEDANRVLTPKEVEFVRDHL